MKAKCKQAMKTKKDESSDDDDDDDDEEEVKEPVSKSKAPPKSLLGKRKTR